MPARQRHGDTSRALPTRALPTRALPTPIAPLIGAFGERRPSMAAGSMVAPLSDGTHEGTAGNVLPSGLVAVRLDDVHDYRR